MKANLCTPCKEQLAEFVAQRGLSLRAKTVAAVGAREKRSHALRVVAGSTEVHMSLTDDCSAATDENASYPQIDAQPVEEIDTEHMIPLVRNAMQVLKTCCELWYPDCTMCQLNKVLQLHTQWGESICRCSAIPKEWITE